MTTDRPLVLTNSDRLISLRNFDNYIACFVAGTRAISSASAVDVVTDFCLRLAQEMGPSANLNTKPDTDRLSSLSTAKSESK
jgi:hypothetical protein